MKRTLYIYTFISFQFPPTVTTFKIMHSSTCFTTEEIHKATAIQLYGDQTEWNSMLCREKNTSAIGNKVLTCRKHKICCYHDGLMESYIKWEIFIVLVFNFKGGCFGVSQKRKSILMLFDFILENSSGIKSENILQ